MPQARRSKDTTSVGNKEYPKVNNLIWLVGAVVIVIFVLGFFGMR